MNMKAVYMVEKTPTSFPDNLDALLDQYQVKQSVPFRDLPLPEYLILLTNISKTKHKPHCMILSLVDKDNKEINVYAPDRLRNEIQE